MNPFDVRVLAGRFGEPGSAHRQARISTSRVGGRSSARLRGAPALVALVIVTLCFGATAGTVRAQQDDEVPWATESPARAPAPPPDVGGRAFVHSTLALEAGVPAPAAASVSLRASTEMRFRRVVSLRARLHTTGWAHASTGALPRGGADVSVGFGDDTVAVYLGGGYARTARRFEDVPYTYGSVLRFRGGAFGTVGFRFGRIDALALDFDVAVGSVRDPYQNRFYVVQYDFALRLRAGARTVLTARASYSELSPTIGTAALDGRVRVRGDDGPRSTFITASFGAQWLSPSGLGYSPERGLTLAIGMETRAGSTTIARAWLDRDRRLSVVTPADRLARRGRSLRGASLGMFAFAVITTSVGIPVFVNSPGFGGFIAGATLTGLGGLTGTVVAPIVLSVGKLRTRRAERVRREVASRQYDR